MTDQAKAIIGAFLAGFSVGGLLACLILIQ